MTTHLEKLKTLAFETDGFACASVGFDVERLAPTYRLRNGVPGGSYAFRIANRLGLSSAIVDSAEAALAADGGVVGSSEEMLAKMEARLRTIDEEHERAEALRVDLEKERERTRQTREKLKKQKEVELDGELEALREEARGLKKQLADLRKAARDLATDGKGGELDPDDPALQAAREIARTVSEKAAQLEKERRLERRSSSRRPLAYEELEAGLPVFVVPFGKNATVASVPPPNEKIPVQLGAVRAHFRLTELQAVASSAIETAKATVSRTHVPRDSRDASNTLDLRGERVDIALERMEPFLDRALRAGIPSAVIIHGHGTGALKRAVRNALRSSPYAESYRAGERGEGGDGVTVVTIEHPKPDAE